MRRRALAAGFALLSATLGACGSDTAPTATPVATAAADHFVGSLSPPPSPEALVVAEVGPDKIYDVEVAAHAHELHLTARAALDDLIGQMLLAQEAQRRGLANDPDVAEAREQARVRALIATDFEQKFANAKDVPQHDVDVMWARPEIRYLYDHPEIRFVTYYRFGTGKKATREAIASAAAASADMTQKLRLRPGLTVAEFVALGDEIALAHGVADKDHKDYWSPLHGGGAAVPAFGNAMFAIPAIGGTGVARTEWGFDQLYLTDIKPEQHLTEAEAAPQIRERLFAGSRVQAFATWLAKLVAQHKITVHNDRIDAITVDSPSEFLGRQAEGAGEAP